MITSYLRLATVATAHPGYPETAPEQYLGGSLLEAPQAGPEVAMIGPLGATPESGLNPHVAHARPLSAHRGTFATAGTHIAHTTSPSLLSHPKLSWGCWGKRRLETFPHHSWSFPRQTAHALTPRNALVTLKLS